MSVIVVTPPSEEPVTLAEARDYCELIGTAHDTLLTSLIAGARKHIEQRLNRALITQTRALRIDAFPCGPIIIREGLLQSLTSVEYVDVNGNPQTFTDYQLDQHSDPPRISPAYGYAWPATRCQMDAVTVTYVCGYGAAAAVPEDIRIALLMIVADVIDNRAASVDRAVENPAVRYFLDPYVSYTR